MALKAPKKKSSKTGKQTAVSLALTPEAAIASITSWRKAYSKLWHALPEFETTHLNALRRELLLAKLKRHPPKHTQEVAILHKQFRGSSRILSCHMEARGVDSTGFLGTVNRTMRISYRLDEQSDAVPHEAEVAISRLESLVLLGGGMATQPAEVHSSGSGGFSKTIWLRRAKIAEICSVDPETDPPQKIKAKWDKMEDRFRAKGKNFYPLTRRACPEHKQAIEHPDHEIEDFLKRAVFEGVLNPQQRETGETRLAKLKTAQGKS